MDREQGTGREQGTAGTVTVVLPAVDDDELSRGLIELTRAARKAGYATSDGLLGGQDGYGAWVDNDVFGMHPYCWCAQDDCPWCLPCLCPDGALELRIDGRPVDAGDFYSTGGSRGPGHREQVTRTELLCRRCAQGLVRAPNFWHKPSGSWVTWYKYIGRDSQAQLNAQWPDILAESLASLRPCEGGTEVRAPGYGPVA